MGIALKYGDVTLVFKKGGTTDKSNHIHISNFSSFSKIFEKFYSDQFIYEAKNVKVSSKLP